MNDDELIGTLIRDAGALADMHGAARCAMILDIVDRLNALRDGLRNEHRRHKEEIELLSGQITKLTTPHPGEGELVVGGQVYKIGG